MQSTNASITFPGDDRQAALTLVPGVAGPNQFHLDIEGDPMPHHADVLMRVELPDQDMGEREIALSHAETNDYVHQGSELIIAGDWDFTLIVRPQGAVEWRAAATYSVEAEGVSAGAPDPAWLFSAFGGFTGLLLMVSGFAGLAHATIRSASRYRPLVGTIAVLAI
ncbi:MAG: hypothetical protein M3451_10615, partial [Chloroflexota bacterium]|nr:hypothetical protein [Chloroflexota bacterium]